ncbi:hypothetical protein CHARACLAT_014766 [Characodon lateralis]|uniref:Uncharacterized protein n=1 Tax=Characodon lateralis TaxID=208331 RepID=A0ABU7F689_9TELE|nr:hypothetical protein [Characodon lateralis]
MVKCYLGLKKKLKPPTNWGFTVYTDKHQWHFCCDRRETQISWVADIIALKHTSDFRLNSSTSKETADLKVSKGGAKTESSLVPTYNHSFSTDLTDRRVSLGDVDWRTTDVPGRHLKTNTVPKCLKPGNLSEATEVPHRRTSMDICMSPRLLPPSVPRHMKPTSLSVLPQTGNKTPGKKALPISGGVMPPNLFNELNLVLSKTGRKSTE